MESSEDWMEFVFTNNKKMNKKVLKNATNGIVAAANSREETRIHIRLKKAANCRETLNEVIGAHLLNHLDSFCLVGNASVSQLRIVPEEEASHYAFHIGTYKMTADGNCEISIKDLPKGYVIVSKLAVRHGARSVSTLLPPFHKLSCAEVIRSVSKIPQINIVDGPSIFGLTKIEKGEHASLEYKRGPLTVEDISDISRILEDHLLPLVRSQPKGQFVIGVTDRLFPVGFVLNLKSAEDTDVAAQKQHFKTELQNAITRMFQHKVFPGALSDMQFEIQLLPIDDAHPNGSKLTDVHFEELPQTNSAFSRIEKLLEDETTFCIAQKLDDDDEPTYYLGCEDIESAHDIDDFDTVFSRFLLDVHFVHSEKSKILQNCLCFQFSHTISFKPKSEESGLWSVQPLQPMEAWLRTKKPSLAAKFVLMNSALPIFVCPETSPSEVFDAFVPKKHYVAAENLAGTVDVPSCLILYVNSEETASSLALQEFFSHFIIIVATQGHFASLFLDQFKDRSCILDVFELQDFVMQSPTTVPRTKFDVIEAKALGLQQTVLVGDASQDLDALNVRSAQCFYEHGHFSNVLLQSGYVARSNQLDIFVAEVRSLITNQTGVSVSKIYQPFGASGMTTFLAYAMHELRQIGIKCINTQPTVGESLDGAAIQRLVLKLLQENKSPPHIFVSIEQNVTVADISSLQMALQKNIIGKPSSSILIFTVLRSTTPPKGSVPFSPILDLNSAKSFLQRLKHCYQDSGPALDALDRRLETDPHERHIQNLIITAVNKITMPVKEWLQNTIGEYDPQLLQYCEAIAFWSFFVGEPFPVSLAELESSTIFMVNKHLMTRLRVTGLFKFSDGGVKVWNESLALAILNVMAKSSSNIPLFLFNLGMRIAMQTQLDSFVRGTRLEKFIQTVMLKKPQDSQLSVWTTAIQSITYKKFDEDMGKIILPRLKEQPDLKLHFYVYLSRAARLFPESRNTPHGKERCLHYAEMAGAMRNLPDNDRLVRNNLAEALWHSGQPKKCHKMFLDLFQELNELDDTRQIKRVVSQAFRKFRKYSDPEKCSSSNHANFNFWNELYEKLNIPEENSDLICFQELEKKFSGESLFVLPMKNISDTIC